jgi:hypothetical protein
MQVGSVGTIQTVLGVRNQQGTAGPFREANPLTTPILRPLSIAVDPTEGRTLWITDVQAVHVMRYELPERESWGQVRRPLAKLSTTNVRNSQVPGFNSWTPMSLWRAASNGLFVQRDEAANGRGAVTLWLTLGGASSSNRYSATTYVAIANVAGQLNVDV